MFGDLLDLFDRDRDRRRRPSESPLRAGLSALLDRDGDRERGEGYGRRASTHDRHHDGWSDDDDNDDNDGYDGRRAPGRRRRDGFDWDD